MIAPIILIACFVLAPFIIILWNKSRVKGKVIAIITRGDLWVQMSLCAMADDYIMYNGKGYECHPKLARLMSFPGGWPKALQETLPAFLIKEDDGVPLDWVRIGCRQVSSTEIGVNLDPNIYRILVREGSKEGSGGASVSGFNWKRALPVLLIAIGIIGFLAFQYWRKQSGGG